MTRGYTRYRPTTKEMKEISAAQGKGIKALAEAHERYERRDKMARTLKQTTESLGHKFITSDLSHGDNLETLKVLNRMLALVAPGYAFMFHGMPERGHDAFGIVLMKTAKE